MGRAQGLGATFAAAVDVVESLMRQLEVSTLAPHDAEQLLGPAAKLRNLSEGICIALAPKAAASGRWRRDGARTEAEWLGRRLGTGDGEAKAVLDTGLVLDDLPATAEAVRSGKLSAHQAAAVASGASADPSSEDRLLRVAERDSLGGLRKERDRVKAAADPDPDARYRRIHRNRHVRTWTDADGAGRGSWSVTPDQQAVICGALSALSAGACSAAHASGLREPSEAYGADALAAMAGAALRPGSLQAGCETTAPRPLPPKAIVRVDHDALVRGTTHDGETCEIAGVGPVPVSLVREWMDAGDLFLTAIVTKGVDVATVAHLGRRPTAFQTTALQWRDVTCRIEGCKRPPTEWDHHEDWAATFETRLWSLGGLCDHHHDLKTHRGYVLVTGSMPGKLRLLPPPDP